jgi:hypothetical protein
MRVLDALVRKFNPSHQPGGSIHGGEFAPKGGGGSGGGTAGGGGDKLPENTSVWENTRGAYRGSWSVGYYRPGVGGGPEATQNGFDSREAAVRAAWQLKTAGRLSQAPRSPQSVVRSSTVKFQRAHPVGSTAQDMNGKSVVIRGHKGLQTLVEGLMGQRWVATGSLKAHEANSTGEMGWFFGKTWDALVRKFNPSHQPGGSIHGGEFAPKGGGSGGGGAGGSASGSGSGREAAMRGVGVFDARKAAKFKDKWVDYYDRATGNKLYGQISAVSGTGYTVTGRDGKSQEFTFADPVGNAYRSMVSPSDVGGAGTNPDKHVESNLRSSGFTPSQVTTLMVSARGAGNRASLKGLAAAIRALTGADQSDAMDTALRAMKVSTKSR